jgi:uncharacterized protein (TIGR02145 family)
MNALNKISISNILILISFFFIILFNACKKETTAVPTEKGTLTDIDGNIYKTVKIGKQWWMAENLKVKRYRNGDTLDNLMNNRGKIDTAKLDTLKIGALYINDSQDSTSPNFNGKLFGYLYNWYSIGDLRNLAPAGWHVPSDDEWKELEMYLGMSKSDADNVNFRGTNEGNKLRKNAGWNLAYDQYKVWGTNESGFSALGGGAIMDNKIWGNPGTYLTGFWWTTTEKDNAAWYRYLDYNKSNVFRFYGPEYYCFSIRCIKDN